MRALGAMLMAVGGADYPPRLERLERLYQEIVTGLTRGRTLGGCRIVPRRGHLLVCREGRALAAPVPAPPGARVNWDGRFSVALPADAPKGLILGALGTVNVNETSRALPAVARIGIAALRDDRGIMAVPALGFCRDGAAGKVAPDALLLRASRPATTAGIKVV